jgi:allophanate hydrolase subunit 2
MIESLKHQYSLAGARQVPGGDQPVVPAADDDGVVGGQLR